MAFAPTADRTVHVDSVNFEPPVTFHLDHVPAYQPGDWGNYIRGAVLALQQHAQLERGLIGTIGGEMPIGGLSSSAAVTIAYLLGLEAVNDLTMTPESNVSLVRYTENKYIGLNNGILDQTVILFSEYGCLTVIDCQAVQIEKVPAEKRNADFEILVVYSGVTDVLVGTDYNNRVAECQEAALSLLTFAGKSPEAPVRLRQVDSRIFEAEGYRLAPLLRKRAEHYFGEMERVTAGLSLWRSGDIGRFGQLMVESGRSSIECYECGSPQLITLYEILCDSPGVYGTRFSGAGFRGNCIALIDPAARESIAEAIHQRYPSAHPKEAEKYSIHICQPGNRASLMSGRS